jgi:putative endonuclease
MGRETLCFIEVKTRTARSIVPAEMAVDAEKQKELVGMSYLYRKHVPAGTPCRFDVVSVYLGDRVDIELRKGAFEPHRSGRSQI